MDILYWKRGQLLWPCVIASRFLIAFTGQMGFEPRDGIFKTFTTFLDCNVFDHFTSIWSTGGGGGGGGKNNVSSSQLIQWGVQFLGMRD